MWEKQPSEALEYVMDFTKRLPGSEVIAIIDQITVSPADGAPGITDQSIYGKKAQFRLSGGTPGTYLVTVRIVSTQANAHEWQTAIKIKDTI